MLLKRLITISKPKRLKILVAFLVFLFFNLIVSRVNAEEIQPTKITDANNYALEQISDIKNFSVDTKPDFEFKFKKKRGVFGTIGAFAKNIFKDEYKNIQISEEIIRVENNETIDNLSPKIEYTKNGQFKILFDNLPPDFKPGKYRVDLTISDDNLTSGKIVEFSQDFTWGVLAFNIDQSQYLPGSNAYLQFAVLDDSGDTLCDASLTVVIDEPGFGKTTLSTADGSIVRNSACGKNNVITEPDYYGHYQLKKTGIYNITVTADTINGQREITDQIEVKKELPFIIGREAPTRIYPKANYGMKINIKAEQDYKGDIFDFVPRDFSILNFKISENLEYPIKNIRIEESDGRKKIIFSDVDLKAGEEYWLSYEFDAPDVSPEFYLLGPLQLNHYINAEGIAESYSEVRQWQVASDIVAEFYASSAIAQQSWTAGTWNNISGTVEPGTSASTNGWLSGSNFTVGKRYLILAFGSHSTNNTNANSGLQVLHGTTPFTESIGTEETDIASTAYRARYFWFTVWTATNEDIEIQCYRSASTAYTNGVNLIAIAVDDLIARGDLNWATSTAVAGALTTTPTAKVTTTWKPLRENDDWLIGAYVRAAMQSTTLEFGARLNIDSGTIRSDLNVEGEDTADTPIFGLGWAEKYSTATHTAAVEIYEEGANQAWNGAGVFALRLNAFQRHAIFSTTNVTNLSVQNQYYEIASTTYTPLKAGYSLVLSGFMADDNGGRVTSLMNEYGTPITLETGGWTFDNTDIRPAFLTDFENFSATTKNFTTNARITLTTTAQSRDPWQAVFSMELNSPPTGVFSSVQQKTDGSGKVDIAMLIDDADDEDCHAKIEYVLGTACNFGSSPARPTLSQVDADTTASSGDPLLTNSWTYQVGTSSAPILTSSGANTVNIDWNTKTDFPNANGEVYCLRLTANDYYFNQATSATTTIAIDNTIPTISSIVTSNRMYKIGDTLIATATVASEAGLLTIGPGSTINGATISSINKINNTTFTLEYTVASGQTDRHATGTIPYVISLLDPYGNKSATSSGNFLNGSLDANAPDISAVIAPNRMYGIGNTLTATITVGFDSETYTLGVSSINNTSAIGNLKKVSVGSSWYDVNWKYRKKITINSSQIVSSQSGFTVLATTTDSLLAHTSFGGNMGLVSGGDIVITDSDAVTPLSYEREYYASTTGEIVLWIKTDVSSSVNKEIYIYYGNSGTTDHSATTGVWDSNYRGVWHMDDNPSGLVTDSSNYNNNMTADATMDATNLVNGRIGKAIIFDGAADELVKTSPSGYTAPSDYTMSAWFYYSVDPSGWDNFYSHTTTGGDYDPQWAMNNNTINIYDSTAINFGTFSGGAGAWHKIDFIRTGDTGSNVIAYIDGAQFGTAQAHNADILVPTTIYIGASALNGELWTGVLDEVRYSEIARSADWITTEYRNQSDVANFLSFSEQESGGLEYYTLDYVVVEGDTDRASGTIPYSIRLVDSYGNSNVAYSGNFSNASLDATRPVIDNVYITTDDYGIGDAISVIIDADQNDYDPVVITVNGKTATGFYDNNDSTYNIIYTVVEGDTDRGANTIPVNIILSDNYGNNSSPAFTVPFTNAATVDANKPKILSISIPSQLYKIGDLIRATTTVLADSHTYTLGTTTINLVSATNLQRIDDSTYTFDYTVQSGDADRGIGAIPISLMLKDQLDQYNSPASTTVLANTASIDANAPAVNSLSFSPSLGLLKIGDTATATITALNNETGLAAGATININNKNVKSSFTEIGSGLYRITYTVQEGDDYHPDNDDLPVNIILRDPAGNESAAYQTADSANRPGVDAVRPVISNVTFFPSSGVLKIGDTATATIYSDGTNYASGTIMINGVNVAHTLAPATGNNYTVTYTVTEGDDDILDAENLTVDITLVDLAGNHSIAYTNIDISGRPGVDAAYPEISTVTFLPDFGVLKIGDTATITITALNSETGLASNTVMSVNGVNVANTFNEIGGGQYQLIYTVIEGHDDIQDTNDLPISFSIKDAAGNISGIYETPDAGNRPGVDGHKPVISNVTFSPSSGLLKIGDTATATIVADGSNYSAVNIIINTVNVTASLASLGGNNYTVSYTVEEGDNNINEISDLPVYIVLSDTAGNHSDAYDAIDPAGRPGVDANKPFITVVAFNPVSGILKVGDTATVTITAFDLETGLASGTTMTINGVDVVDTFTEIGSGLYRVTYTVNEGDNDVSDDADLPVILNLRDYAGNVSVSYTEIDIENRPGVDGHSPVISNVTFTPSSGMLIVGDTATATIQADNSGFFAGTIIVNGKDVGASFFDNGDNSYRISYTVSEGDNDIADGSDLPITVSLLDVSGNESNIYTTADAGGRPGIDANTPTIPGNLSYFTHDNTSITLTFGATSTESNFAGYKIFYKLGSSGVSENDSVWDSSDDGSLGNILFNVATSTTVIGLDPNSDYVFNIWVYDFAGNKSVAITELTASTNYKPTDASELLQKENDNETIVPNGLWAIDQTMILSATSSDHEDGFINYYYEVLPVADDFTSATSVPAGACNSGDAFGDCTSKIWKFSTGPAWYNTNWLYRKQIAINADMVENDVNDFPVLANAIDDDLRRNARSDGHDIMFTASDGVTPLNFERKYWDSSNGEIIAWIKTNLSASTDNFIYLYYGNSSFSTDVSTTTGVWDSSYLGVWHMDEAPTGAVDDIKDSSGNNRNMTSYNMDSSKRVPTATGYAYNFDGAGDYLEDADGENYINGLSAFTVEVWLKSNRIASDRGFIIGSQPAGNDSFFTLRYDDAGANGGGNDVIKGAITTSVSGELQMESSNFSQTTNWQHLVFRWQSGTQYELLINGVLDTPTSNSPAGTGLTTGADRLRIGQGGKDTTALLGWDGLIDEVRISNTYRNDAWEKTAYNNQSNPTSFALFGAQDAVRIFNLPESSTGYKWQVLACDIYSACSEWVPFDTNTPNFKVDNTPPTAPGSLVENSHDSTFVIFNLNATSSESFFDEYRIYYKIYDGTPVSTNDNMFSSIDDGNLGDILFNHAATTTIPYLTAGTQYEFNIWAFDESGQSASATPITVTTSVAFNRPTGIFKSAQQKNDGTGAIDISIEVNDADNDPVRAKIDYVLGANCNFASPLDPTLDENIENISATNLPNPLIDNQSVYQIGSGTEWILTSPTANTVDFDWLSILDIPNASSTYCLRLTTNDGGLDQLLLATTTVYIDNFDPSAPGSLSLNMSNTNSIVLNYGATTTETNFSEYKIYYKIADGSSPTESDSVLSSSTDQNLGNILFNNVATTTVANLDAGAVYSFAIWAYDIYGNKASSSFVNFGTNHIPSAPTNLKQYRFDGITEIANSQWTPEDVVKFYAETNDSDSAEVVSIYFELLTDGDTFTTATTVPFNACSPGDSWGVCDSKVWKATSATGDYSVMPFSGTSSPANLPNSNSGYKWQAMACDHDNVCSDWTRFDEATPNFKVDYLPPTAPGNLSVVSYTSDSVTLAFGATTSEENFREYIIYYKEGTSGVTETDSKHGSSTDSDLAHILFNNTSTTTISGLNPGLDYVFNIFAYDWAGNKNYATFEISTTTNNKPSVSIVSASLKTNGTGAVDIVFNANDTDFESLSAKLEYVSGADCNFASPLDPTLDETDANATSTQGDAKIENDNPYQIGNSSGWILTGGGQNTVSFDWLSNTDLPNQNGTYCLRIRTNDKHEDSLFATTTLTIDNLAPSIPGNLSLASSHGDHIILNYGATSTETNWSRYRIFYKVGVSTVSESDQELIDNDLLDINFNNTSTTSVSGLLSNTQYSFRIFAYDIYGNKSQSGQVTFTTNSYPSSAINSAVQKIDGSGRVDISLEVYDTNGDDCFAKLEFATGTSCVFSESGDPDLDDNLIYISADYGLPGIDNNNEYQVGTSGAPIITDQGSNTINLDWISKNDLPTANGDYCLRLTVTDGADLVFATTTLTLDNVLPVVPGNLIVDYVDIRSIRLNYGLAGSDSNFKEYKVFYKEGTNGVSENDSVWDLNSDASLGIEDFGTSASTTIGGLIPNTDYVFNIWIYDDYGNKASAISEVATSTLVPVGATWREAVDTPDPTLGLYATKEQTVRLRVAVANSGTWFVDDYRYNLEYGIKDGTCANTSAWTTVPTTATNEHFEMKSSVYFIENASTTSYLNGGGFAFQPGYMVQAPYNQSGTIVLYGNEYTELEYTIAATNDASRSATYCFRATNQGAGIDDYGVYPEFSLTPPPISNFVSAKQRGDGSGRVDIRFTADDYSNQNLRVKMEFATGTTCNFTTPGDPTLDTLNANTTATYGDPLIDNNAVYQIGTGLAYILTQYGENTVDTDWLSNNNLPGVEGTYCLRTTANDLFDDQTTPATTTLIVDNKAPSIPGNISLGSKTITSVTINFGATSSDMNFGEYRIYYKEGSSGVTESDLMHASNTDPVLGNVLFNGAASTTINNLTSNRQYVFKIFAYDKYGNKSASLGEFTTKLVPSIAGYIYDSDGVTPVLTSPNITMIISGEIKDTVSASAEDGRFIFLEIDPPATGTPMLVYIDGNPIKGATYSLYGGAGQVNDLNIYKDKVVLKNYASIPLTSDHINQFDNNQDADIPIEISGNNFSILGDYGLHIWSGCIFENKATNIALSNIIIDGTLVASSTEYIYVTGDWNSNDGAFLSASTTVEFTANDTGNRITTNGKPFWNLVFNGAGDWILTDSASTTATTTIIQGTLIQGGDINFETGSFVIELGAGFTKASGTGKLIFEDLGEGVFEDKNDIKNNLGNVQIGYSPAVTRLNSDMVADSLLVNTGDSLFVRGYELDITNSITVYGTLDCIDDKEGDGTIITLGTNWTVLPTASFIAGNSTTTFDNATGGVISTGGTDANHDFYNLSFAKTSATTTILNSYPLKVSGDLTIGSNSTLDVSPANYDIYASGNWLNAGTFNARNATTTFDAVSTGKIINPGQSSFNRVVFNSATGGWSIIGNATSTSDWIIDNASVFSVASNITIEVRGQYIILDTTPNITTWNSGSTLFLNNGSSYTLAAKNQSAETYANLKIGADTDIRMWNSGASAINVDSTGSLYSMDHGNANGSLYIWGDYIRSSGIDYWNYAKDFDGEDISSSPRVCQVQVFGGSALSYNNSGLEINGTSNATTSITNQGSGSYSFSLVNTNLNMNYFQIRNMDSDGLNLSGTTTLGNINNGDLELEINSGSLIKVTSDTINASPWSTSTNMRFATSSIAISGYNVTLSGTPNVPWTFISHYGNLSSESYDSDSGDPRGYILWDDSPSYSPKSQNWRWYHDEDKETPVVPITLENYAPQIVGNGNLIKLRMTIKETGGITGNNVKMRLQYSTDSNFSSNVNWVGEKGSTTALWTYGEGVDNDNDLISALLLSDSVVKATHNESGISTSTYTQNADDANEWEFTLYANSPATSTTYYFRAYSDYFSIYSTYSKEVLNNDLSSYPSVVISSGFLSFEIEGLPSGTNTEGITTDFPTTATSVPFGILPLNTKVEGAHRFKITTNAETGYQLFVYQRQNLVSNTGAYISAISSTNNNPGPWPENPDPGAFGYHAGDDSLSGVSPSRFSPDNMYAKFNNSLEEISYSPMPVSDDTVDFVYRVEVNNLQSAGDYRTSIVYILVPQF